MIADLLLRDMLMAYPAQPATAVWRAVEIGALLRVGIPQGRGLDLGCGDGKLTAVLFKRASGPPRRLVGIDIDPLETQSAELSGLCEAVHTGAGSCIPEESGSFDFVVSNSVLEHIPEIIPVLQEVARVLRPGGRFLFTVPGPGFHAILRGSLLPWVSRQRYLEELDRRLAHLRYPSAANWCCLCAAVGLTTDGCLGYLDRDETRTWETLSRFTGGLLYAVCGKRQPPIRIQRDLGLRQIQNRAPLPSLVASGISMIIRSRLRAKDDGWLPDTAAGCLLVYGTRR
jgi:SAM-dependent methyltransferase